MKGRWHRRAFLGASVAGMVAEATIARGRTFEDEETTPRTFTYKTVGDCAIKADVYGAAGGQDRPVAAWIHGGALIVGDRRGVD